MKAFKMGEKLNKEKMLYAPLVAAGEELELEQG